MKRLLKSSKFWLAVIGSVFAVGSYEFTGEINLAYWILTAFISGILGNTAEDMIIKFKSIPGGGIPNPNPDPDDGGKIKK